MFMQAWVFALLTVTQVYASDKAYDLQLEVLRAGQKIYAPRLTVREGEQGRVEEATDAGKTFIEVVATETTRPHKGVMMNFVVGYISADGTRTVMSRPRILVHENEPARVTLTDRTDDAQEFTFSVVARSL